MVDGNQMVIFNFKCLHGRLLYLITLDCMIVTYDTVSYSYHIAVITLTQRANSPKTLTLGDASNANFRSTPAFQFLTT